jgi:uncharacterized protein (UPF0335 family)
VDDLREAVDDAPDTLDRVGRAGFKRPSVLLRHERFPMAAAASTPASFAKDQLRAIVERIERLEEEKAALSEDIKEVYAEAKGNGFDTKILRTVVRLRKQDSSERAEQEALLDLYMHALGMVLAEAAE